MRVDFDLAGSVDFFRVFVRRFGFFFVVFVKFSAAGERVGLRVGVHFFLFGFHEAGGKCGDVFFA
jgi:hypothetical protein